MRNDTPEVTVTDDTENHRFVAEVDGSRAGIAVYHQAKGARLFVHTEVEDEYEGKGVASSLVRGALDQMRESGTTVVPLCPYVRTWIGRHDGYEDLIDEDLDRALRP